MLRMEREAVGQRYAVLVRGIRGCDVAGHHVFFALSP